MRFSLRAADVDLGGREESRLTLEFSAESLGNVLERLDQFLRGCGYVPSGELRYVEDLEAFPDEPTTAEVDHHIGDEYPACEGDF